MSLSIQPKPLLDALNRVINAIERRSTIPILSHALLSAKGGKLTLRGTDMDSEISVALDCEGDLDPICAPADRLQATLARLAERGAVSVTVEGQSLTMTSGRARSTMPVLLPDDFPSLSADDIGYTFQIGGKVLATLLSATAFAMANSSDRLHLNGVCLFAGTLGQGKDRNLCGVATDGLKLSAREVAADLPEDMPQIILPRKAVLALGKMVEPFESVSIEITARRFIAEFGPTRFVTKLVEGEFPDWRRVVPDLEPLVSYDSDALASAIATAFSAVQSDKKMTGVKLALGESETEFTARSYDGTASGADACPHSLLAKPPASEIGVNPKFLLEIISALSADTIEISFADAGAAILITAAALTDRRAIAMPMRI